LTLQIFCDDNHEGNWFKSLCTSLNDIPLSPIKSRGENPPYIEKLLRYDRPDIILVEDEVSKLILEKTREVPTGHNVGQRFGRLVNAAEEGVMVIFFCHLLLENMENIHRFVISLLDCLQHYKR
jgi:hypothetical protein